MFCSNSVLILTAAGLLFGCGLVKAAEPEPLPLWEGGLPENAIVHEVPESTTNRETGQNVQGFNRSIDNVSIPTVTVFPAPAGKATGAAIVIFPGGGFTHLAIDKEGYDIARRLNEAGVTGIVVKYRTRTAKQDPDIREAQMAAIRNDGKRAVRLARANAEQWGIDPNRIGVIGFSAGGYQAASVAVDYDSGERGSDDPVQRESSRPDFAAMIYPGMPPDFSSKVDGGSPPMFFVNAVDDETTPVERCMAMFEAARGKGIITEMHLFNKGGHGFGLGVNGGAVTNWPRLLLDWMLDIGVIK